MTGVFGAARYGVPRSNGSIASRSLGLPPAMYPAAVASNAHLTIAVDRLQTRLAQPLSAGANSMTVQDGSLIIPNTLLSIDDEIVQTQAGAGNVWSIIRGIDGTTPAVHLQSALVSGFVDAWHHNALVSEIQAIESTLGPNLSKIPASAFTISSAYDFTPQTPGGALTPGANVVTVSPVPEGVNGTDQDHFLWIDQGTGTPEAVEIIGGAAIAGAPSGTLFINCANAHTGDWRISSATAGIQEALQTLYTAGNGGTVLIPQGNWPIHATITMDRHNVSLQGAGRGATLLTADLNVCPVILVGTGTHGTIFNDCIYRLTVTRAPGTIPNNCIGVLWNAFNQGLVDTVEYNRHYIAEKVTHPAGSTSIGFTSARCTMWGNVYAHIHIEHTAGVKYSTLYMGDPSESVAGAPDYGVVISHDANDIKFIECDWLPTAPITGPKPMQWCVAFTDMPLGTGMFIFNDCNWENVAQGAFTSSATCAGINWLQINGGRTGTSITSTVVRFNPATVVRQFQCFNGNFTGLFELTNPIQSQITGCLISGVMTITGGEILVANNVFTTQPVFTGTFACLNIGPNSYVFNGAFNLEPTLAGASGLIYYNDNNASDAAGLIRRLSTHPEGIQVTISGTSLTPSDDFCTIVTNPGTVTTIVLPYPSFSGVIHFAITQNITFQTGGNIATSLAATPGQLVTAAYSAAQGKWFLS